MKILGITTTYNVSEKIPYIMPYYQRMEIDKLIVYDNYSTDNSVELLSKYPFVEIRYYETDSFDDNVILNLKNNAWKEYINDYDWCVVSDFDEVLFSERNFKEVLTEKTQNGKTYFNKIGLNLLSREFPPINDKLIHENISRGYIWDCDENILGVWGQKTLLFDIKKVKIEYTEIGAHSCKFNEGSIVEPFDDDINFFHIKMIDYQYLLKQSMSYHERIKKHNLTCYDFFRKNLSSIYENAEKKSITISDYISSNNSQLYPQQLILVEIANTLEDGMKAVDNILNYIDKNVFYQIGVMFYSNTKTNYDYNDLHHYSQNKGLVPFVGGEIDNLNIYQFTEGYAYKFRHNHKFLNPWFTLCNKKTLELLSKPSLIESIKKASTNKIDEFIFENINFSRFENFIKKSPSTLGCYLIVKNEEKNIAQCLECLEKVCDEIVVVDTGSDDETVKICKNYSKVNVEHFTWINDFSAARNYAMSFMKSDYIFSIDADEFLTDSLILKLNNLKKEGFKGYLSTNMFIELDNNRFYLGGRQIVKNNPENMWKYKVHEKLYYNESNDLTLSGPSEYIVHKPHSSKSHYNKYAEIYYNELNNESAFSNDNTAHYYYYLFFTLNDIDPFIARKYLHNIFNVKNIVSITENQGYNLYDSGWIDEENFIINSLIGGYDNHIMVLKYYPKLTTNMGKYLCLNWCYEHGADLTETQYIDLAYISYNYGLFKDFIKLTKELVEKYPDSEIGNNNIDFIENILKKLEKYQLVIDCKDNHSCLASSVNLLAQYFNCINIAIDDVEKIKDISLKPFNEINFIKDESEVLTNKIVLNGNVQYKRNDLKDIMQKIAYENKENLKLYL